MLLLLGTLLAFVVVVAAIAAVVAYQAAQRGYSFLVWVGAAMLGNPVFLLILLGVLPNRAMRRRREKELDDIRARVEAIPRKVAPPPKPTVSSDIQRSMGDAETVLPDRSIGDAVTRLPERSIGDEPTRD
jgi:hypothetical protein